MVTVDLTRSGKGFCLTVYGHARTAPKGEDLVCCAASTLVYTAAQCALDLYGEGALRQFPQTLLETGNAQVAAVATEEALEKVEQMFRTAATGLRMLASQYPENVCYAEHVHGGKVGLCPPHPTRLRRATFSRREKALEGTDRSTRCACSE